jgi:hypothetical protein
MRSVERTQKKSPDAVKRSDDFPLLGFQWADRAAISLAGNRCMGYGTDNGGLSRMPVADIEPQRRAVCNELLDEAAQDL